MGDIYADYNRIDQTFKKLEESDLSNSNKKILEEFAENLMAQNISDHKIYRYIQTFRVLAPEIDFKLEEAEKQDLVRLVGKINQNNIKGKDYSPVSRKELKTGLKKFYGYLGEKEKLDFVTCTVKKSNRSKIDPSKLPERQDVAAMIASGRNPRDRALISLLWESGARIGELLYVDWKDISFEEDIARVELDGKTGQRNVPFKDSITLIKEWKDFQEEGAKPVFTSLDNSTRINYRTAYKQIQKLGERADIDANTNPHAFRKSRATYLASQGANIFQLMRLFGWSKPKTAKTYVRLANSDVEELIKETAVSG